jgi:hypothetical protein
VGIPEDFDYSSENFNSDIDELYPEHRNSTKNTFKCKARIAHIASAIDNFDATMRRHGTA